MSKDKNPSPVAHVAGSVEIRDIAVRAFNEAIDADGYETSYDIIEKAIRAAIETPERLMNVNDHGSNGETLEKTCTFDPKNDPKNENIQSPVQHLMGWQPIETAPKDGRHVLLYCDYYGIGRCAWESWRGVWRSDDPNHGIGFPQPTHWMPLPDYPAGSVRAENARRAAIAANPEDQP